MYKRQVSKDGLTYTYKIRKGVKWYTSDGEEYANVTAKDFVTGLKHAADSKAGGIYLVQDSIAGLSDYLSGTNKDFSKMCIRDRSYLDHGLGTIFRPLYSGRR